MGNCVCVEAPYLDPQTELFPAGLTATRSPLGGFYLSSIDDEKAVDTKETIGTDSTQSSGNGEKNSQAKEDDGKDIESSRETDSGGVTGDIVANTTDNTVQSGTSSGTTQNEDPDGKSVEVLEERETCDIGGGSCYTGQWLGTLKHGYGVLRRADGSQYTGQFKDDKANGHGKFRHSRGDIYEGQWKNDQACGEGTFLHTDGSSYRGQWAYDLQEGYGVERWTDNSVFEGQYKHSKKEGNGKFVWGEGSIYEGEFLANDINGKGTYTWNDGRRYEGQWAKNHMNGHGVMTWLDGRRYEGEYLNDKKHGEGKFNWADGRVYEGQWHDGKQHGTGFYTNCEGVRRPGLWNHGKRLRWQDGSKDPSDEKRDSGDESNSRFVSVAPSSVDAACYSCDPPTVPHQADPGGAVDMLKSPDGDKRLVKSAGDNIPFKPPTDQPATITTISTTTTNNSGGVRTFEYLPEKGNNSRDSTSRETVVAGNPGIRPVLASSEMKNQKKANIAKSGGCRPRLFRKSPGKSNGGIGHT